VAEICMVGWWHQAMVYGAGLADLGHRVVGVCEGSDIAERLNRGEPTIYEPGLAALMRRNLRKGRLRYTTNYAEALRRAEFAYISIDTPVARGDRSDLKPILEAARSIGRFRPKRLVLCVSAQVPVGTCSRLLLLAQGAGRGGQVKVAYVPEFLRLGDALRTFRRADRVVVGSDDPATARRVSALYKALNRPTLLTDLRSAEMAKHACNAFLATSISFINELADLSEETGADAAAVAAIMKLDQRIGKYAFLSPGLGFAGGTLGREIRILQEIGRKFRVMTPLMNAVASVNRRRVERIVRLLRRELGSLRGKRLAVLGLTYKPGTSTLRRSMALDIISALRSHGAAVSTFDPRADRDEVPPGLTFEWCASPYLATATADAAILVTDWPELTRLQPRRLGQSMRTRVMFDTKGVLDGEAFRAAGFRYLAIGRPGPAQTRQARSRVGRRS
jgi:UDPglucose 6-dehydrogenase